MKLLRSKFTGTIQAPQTSNVLFDENHRTGQGPFPERTVCMKFPVIAVFYMVFSAASAFSQMPPGEPPPCKMPPMQPFGQQGPGAAQHMMVNISDLKSLLTEINIDKTVVTKIIAITRSFMNSFDERMIKVQREELNIKEELLKEKPDLTAIQAIISRKTQIFGDIEFAQIKRDLEIKSLLTQDEYDRWKSALLQKMKDMMPRLQDRLPPGPAEKKQMPPK
jgi:hypothetical protein